MEDEDDNKMLHITGCTLLVVVVGSWGGMGVWQKSIHTAGELTPVCFRSPHCVYLVKVDKNGYIGSKNLKIVIKNGHQKSLFGSVFQRGGVVTD